MHRSRVSALVVVAGVLAGVAVLAPAASAVPVRTSSLAADSGPAVQHDVSPPLRSMTPSSVVAANASTAPATGVSFDGLGAGTTGFTVGAIPPDPSGDVGPNDYVEVVNTAFAVFSKVGVLRYGPVATNTLWSGFTNGCATTNDGLAVVRYDSLADRWIISTASVSKSSSSVPYLECVAVSATSDPTGAYNRYAFAYPSYVYRPKLSVWSDAYYLTFDAYDSTGTVYKGPQVCALDRTAMLQGQAAAQQCFLLGTQYDGVLAADVDGPVAPPAGAAAPLVALATLTSLASWQFHVDWANVANTTVTGPTLLTVQAFDPVCRSSSYRPCIPQPGTSQLLEGGGARLMDRLAYRNFGDHESLVVNQSVATGVRWYELRTPAAPVVYQEGTYAPDSTRRWMGSVAQDQAGDIGLGYSASSSTVFPQISYTARRPNDALGEMTEPEGTLQAGGGSQSAYNSDVSRWGRDSSLTVDPSDGCTFWYVNEYLANTGSFNWHTRIATFRLPYCGTTVALTSSANPAVALQPVTLTAGVTSGGEAPTGSVTFLDGEAVLGSASFASGSATFTTSALAAGTHTLTARYDGNAAHAGATSPALSQRMDFTDVPPNSPFYADITWLTERKIANGFSDGSFRPADGVTRQAFAAYLYRYVYGVDAGPCPGGTSAFNDVPDASAFCGDIKAMAAAHITSGFADGGFHPTAFVTRQAAAAFFYRASHYATDAGTCPPGTSAFPDVPDNSPFCGDITWMSSTTPQPITTGFADGGFHPGATVTRQAVAAFFHRYNSNFG